MVNCFMIPLALDVEDISDKFSCVRKKHGCQTDVYKLAGRHCEDILHFCAHFLLIIFETTTQVLPSKLI